MIFFPPSSYHTDQGKINPLDFFIILTLIDVFSIFPPFPTSFSSPFHDIFPPIKNMIIWKIYIPAKNTRTLIVRLQKKILFSLCVFPFIFVLLHWEESCEDKKEKSSWIPYLWLVFRFEDCKNVSFMSSSYYLLIQWERGTLKFKMLNYSLFPFFVFCFPDSAI